MFFAPHDKPTAEQLIRRGMAMDPTSAAIAARMPPDAAAYEWPVLLSSLYAAAILGAESAWGTYNDLRTHLDKVNTPYAMQVRRTLETTDDASLLVRVGSILTRRRSSGADAAMTQALDEARALGVRYLERAQALDPSHEGAKAALVRIRLADAPAEIDRLATGALERYLISEDITEYARKDGAAATQQREQVKAQAEDVLKRAAAHPGDPAFSAAVMTAHHVLATAALREGDRERALRHLRDSVDVPPSDQLHYAPPFSWGRLVNRLLKDGERERVVEFLEAFARLTIVERRRLLDDAQAIREGRMTHSYQRMFGRDAQ